MPSALTNPMDALRIANAIHARQHPNARPPFEFSLVAVGGPRLVHCAGGLQLPAGVLPDVPPDLVLIPGLEYQGEADCKNQLDSLHAESELLKQYAKAGVQIGAHCSGTLLLAHTGLLDNKAATTSWWLVPTFIRLYPSVILQTNAMVAEDGQFITAGAVTALFTLLLRIIEQRAGPELAQNTARFLLVDYTQQSQAAFISKALMQRPRSAFGDRVDDYLQRQISTDTAPISVQALAAHAAVSQRTLLRRFRALYQQSPQAHLQDLRIERAKALLTATALDLSEILSQCGYADLASFRKLFKRKTALTPSAYRAQFSTAARPIR